MWWTIARFAEVPSEELRTHLLEGARVVLAGLGTPAADHDARPDGPARPLAPRRGRVRGRRGGRPPALGQAEITLARQRYRAGHTVEEIADALGVSRATVYRHLAAPSSDT